MRIHDAMMFGIYLLVIASGASMHDRFIGEIQMTLGAGLFAFRLWFLFGRKTQH